MSDMVDEDEIKRILKILGLNETECDDCDDYEKFKTEMLNKYVEMLR